MEKKMRYTFQSSFSAIVLKRDAENENAAITLAEQAVKGISVSSCTEKQDRFQLEGVYHLSSLLMKQVHILLQQRIGSRTISLNYIMLCEEISSWLKTYAIPLKENGETNEV